MLHKIIAKITDRLYSKIPLPDALRISIENLIASIFRKDVRFTRKRCTRGQVYAISKNAGVVISNASRAFWLYRNGIESRIDRTYHSYCLDSIDLQNYGTVLDCGANNGDFFRAIRSRYELKNYYGFEPSLADFTALRDNLPTNARLYNFALGEFDGTAEFYLDEANADSSLVQPASAHTSTEISVVRLDSFLEKHRIPNVDLLKVEAEGSELEVLKGLGAKLSIVEYIAIDGGHERGANRDQTLTNVVNYLLPRGFSAVNAYLPWGRMLFRSSKAKSGAELDQLPK